jgi:hypothetical protein
VCDATLLPEDKMLATKKIPHKESVLASQQSSLLNYYFFAQVAIFFIT